MKNFLRKARVCISEWNDSVTASYIVKRTRQDVTNVLSANEREQMQIKVVHKKYISIWDPIIVGNFHFDFENEFGYLGSAVNI